MAGFLFGAVIGAAIGFMYAPHPGKETRVMLKDTAEKAADRARDVADKAREAAVSAEKKVEDRLGKKKETA